MPTTAIEAPPTPRARTRVPNRALLQAAMEAQYHPVAAHVIASRDFPDVSYVDAQLNQLDPPDGLPDIERAAARVASAITHGEVIALETDHDVDGVTSHAVLKTALTRYFGHPGEKVLSYIGHRLNDGYGLSQPVMERILSDRPTLVITADNGSSDQPRIASLAQAGIDTIVTDHHDLPEEGPPASAYACVTPKRMDSQYPDSLIAGCMVAFLLSVAVRQHLINEGRLPSTAPRLTGLLGFVALGTVADCVSISRSRNNRALIRAGLRQINAMDRPCWQAIKPYVAKEDATLTEEHLAFGIGPRINARGRLDEAMAGVRFLLSESLEEAKQWAELLDQENDARKAVEKDLKEQATEAADRLVAQGYKTLVVWLPNGHSGVHGIVASRIVERHGRPAIMLSPKVGNDMLVSGSARGIDDFHVRQALQAVADLHPDLSVAFGGHAGAAGMTLRRTDIDRFREAFEHAAAAQLGERELFPVLWNDGPLAPEHFTLETLAALDAIGPYGRECDQPVFENTFTVRSVKAVGKTRTHLKLSLSTGGPEPVQAIWFGAKAEAGDPDPMAPGDTIRATFQLMNNVFRDRSSLEIRILQAEHATTPLTIRF